MQAYQPIDKTIKAWKLSSWAAQGVLTFYDTSNAFSELETITKIKATSYFKSITFFRLIWSVFINLLHSRELFYGDVNPFVFCCKSSHSVNWLSSWFWILVLTLFLSPTDEPKFIGVNQYIPVDLNKSVTLTCNATGNPQPQIRWRRSDSQPPLSETTTLTLSRIGKEDLGMYICEASALYGAFTTKKLDVYLLLKGTPSLMEYVNWFFSLSPGDHIVAF